ncbi:uncharacterized protein LOC136082941 [Hydra vulgaris]|uniref:Uncharacterized protein LOC136082941 n=1 Tax=Hydra vulgaris TaxID=6087 RepID=A0ABM4C9V8_HYDVU
MLGMLKYPNDFQLAQRLNQLWCKDTATIAVLTYDSGFALRQAYIINKPTTKRTFSFCIPLRHIFGFCDDYDKVIFGFKHTITFVKKTDNDAIFKLATVADAKVNLNEISLFIPHMLPADAERFKLFNQVASKTNIPVCYHQRQCDTISVQQPTRFSWDVCTRIDTERPRYIIIAFQTIKSGDQNANPSIFDHCDLSNIYISLNFESYPAVDYNLSFPNKQFSRAYRDAAVFNEKFYGMNDMITHRNITPSDYKDLYPIFVFDVSKQSKKLLSGLLQIKVTATLSTTVSVGIEVFAVTISDKMLQLQSDGRNFFSVY